MAAPKGSLRDRLKKGFRAAKRGAKGFLEKNRQASNFVSGLTAGAINPAAKKRKLKAGMMKATGQSEEQAAKIKQRTDIAAIRKKK